MHVLASISDTQFKTATTPAIASDGKILYLAWRAEGDVLLCSSLTPGDTKGWSAPYKVPAARSTSARSDPVLTCWNDKIYITWLGMSGRPYKTRMAVAPLYENAFWVATWEPNFRPAIAAFRGKLYMVWGEEVGILDRRSRLWFAVSSDGRTWNDFKVPLDAAIDKNFSYSPPTLASTPDALVMTWRASEGDQVLWNRFDGKIWSDAESVCNASQTTTYSPSVAADPAGNLYFAYRGADGLATVAKRKPNGVFHGPFSIQYGHGAPEPSGTNPTLVWHNNSVVVAWRTPAPGAAPIRFATIRDDYLEQGG